MSNHSSSLSAIIFNGNLVQHLENHPTLRLPSTYVGVRRVRPTLTKKRDRRPDKNNNKKDDDDDDDDGWVPNNVVGEDSSSTQNGSGRPANTPNNHNEYSTQDEEKNDNNNNDNNNNNNNENSSPKEEIVYKITNPDGTQRRMTKQEKKQLKYKLAQAKRSERKEDRQAKHEELIREQKAGRRERQKAKKLAWRNKKRQRRKNADDGEVLQRTGADDDGGNNGSANNEERVRTPNEADGTTHGTAADASSSRSPLPTSAGGRGSNGPSLDEELATLRGDRRGIPPVMLTPAATRVARDEGALPQRHQIPRESPEARTAAVTTVLDPVVSARWASQLRRSMVPAETSRAREDMRPMAYRLVPEAWKRLRPASLLSSSSPSERSRADGEVPAEDAKETTAGMEVAEEGTAAKSDRADGGPRRIDAAATPGSHSFAPLRDPSPSFDEDSHAIFRHLQRRSDLHIACGAIFGCDFLLYNGRREDQHSFAGLRVYGTRNSDRVRSDDDDDGGARNEFPIPSTYDMAGYVRSMNTARKIALVGTVVREDDGEGGTVARVAIVDLALEKVLTAPTHVRKGNVDKRRLVEGAGDFARTKF